jgi:chromosome segregation ATPase
MASEEVLKALESLHKELERLEPAIKHIEAAQQVTEMAKSIPNKHIEFLQKTIENDINHKNELKNEFSSRASEIHEESRNLQKITLEIQQSVKEEQEALRTIKDAVQDFYQRIEKVNFPDRLDKVDATVAGIMVATQSLQGRLDNIERNISDRLKSLQDYQNESRSITKSSLEEIEANLQTKIAQSSKRQRAYFITSLVLFILLLTAALLARLKT